MAVRVLNESHGDNFALYHADCVNFARQMQSDTVGFSIYSPPFGDLFVYSDSVADMGNSATNGEFFDHYRFIVGEIFRMTKPGRLCAVHCSDLPLRKWKDGHIGLQPFSDELRQLHTDVGWIMHSRVTIWRDPVVEMQRTKALGLLYKQLMKNSTMSRVGMADYLLVFRKPGDAAEPVEHKPDDITLDMWQKWASPVWMDIKQTNTLNVRIARDSQDEKHLCPLQLDLIERAIRLWSNPGDTVFSPFAGVGSEGVVAINLGRRFVGTELKESYFNVASQYLGDAEREASTPDLVARMANSN